jgi:FkbM family methyltransferase
MVGGPLGADGSGAARTAMNFDDALKRYLPRVWFRFKFLKYKYRGRGEPELRLMRHLVAPGTTAIDIGSSIGLYSTELARHAGKVVAFEANPQVAAFARAVVPRNVEVINIALSSRLGVTSVRIPVHAGGHPIDELGTIEAANPLHAAGIGAGEVPMRRLDDLGIADCSFIKIDVEGHEEAVLDGAAALIAAQRPILMIELNEAFTPGVVVRVTQRFVALSYRGYILLDGRLQPISAFDPAIHQHFAASELVEPAVSAARVTINNFIFIPEEKRERVLARLS